MDYFPLFTKLSDRQCLVVGGGDIALRKVNALLKAGANITVCSPTINESLQIKVDAKAITFIEDVFKAEYLNEQWISVAATNDSQVNKYVAECANQQRIFVDVVDNLELSSFIMPAIVDRSPIIVAISSAGNAPVLVRLIKQRLQSILPEHIGRLATLSGEFREAVKARITLQSLRRRYWENLFNNGNLATFLQKGDDKSARTLITKSLNTDFAEDELSEGDVVLVGAGPGSPELLTLKALQSIQAADIVLYDQLVSAEILALVRSDAQLISVGKKAGIHEVQQAQTNKLLVKFARQGKRVVRLKGGDPFIFGRGGEELEELALAKINFQVVPAITAASGCSAYAGIPLTHRDHAQSVIFVTGHTKADGKQLNWALLAGSNQTLVIYMGLLQAAEIKNKLLKNGLSSDMPVALVNNGTRADQKVVIGKLNELDSLGTSLSGPTLMIIGTVVSLADKLHWFERNKTSASNLLNDSL